MPETAFHSTITLLQALQLMGALPSVFFIFLIGLLACRGQRQAWVPMLYFCSLACSFILPLVVIYPPLDQNLWIKATLTLGESMLVAVSFLLIMQFLLGMPVPLPYWLVLAIPLIGGSPFLLSSMLSPMECLADEFCKDAADYKSLYNIFSASFVFLLLVYYSSQRSVAPSTMQQQKHQYWLIMSLILLNLCLLVVDLLFLAQKLSFAQTEIIITTFKLTFIYLVMTSLFRVFYPGIADEVVRLSAKKQHDPDADKPVVERITQLLEQDRIYREMRLNRAAFADKVGVSEHQLSRIVNHYFGKSVIELINDHRIEDAKRRLRDEPDTQVTVIGFEAGFNSIASFNRVFKDKVGVSPTQWREGKVS